MHINELSTILNHHFNFHKARSDCLAKLVIAMITVKTVNFTHLASAFVSKSLRESCYKRIQRFFRFFKFDPVAVASLVLGLFKLKGKKLSLALDRTNWKFGKMDINILMLNVTYRGIALPLMWSCLPKKGNSNTRERIDLIQRILLLVGPENIACLLGDREFVGAEWIQWLDDQSIPFLFRIRNNSLLEGILPVNVFFSRLSPRKKVRNAKTVLWGKSVYLSIRWSYKKDELVTIISNRKLSNPFKVYRRRWEIETFFGCLKKRGFCFEDTHLTCISRVDTLVFVLVIAFCWSYLVGEAKEVEAPVQVKSHGRKAKSTFRYGFDELRCIFLKVTELWEPLFRWLKLLIVSNQTEVV